MQTEERLENTRVLIGEDFNARTGKREQNKKIEQGGKDREGAKVKK